MRRKRSMDVLPRAAAWDQSCSAPLPCRLAGGALALCCFGRPLTEELGRWFFPRKLLLLAGSASHRERHIERAPNTLGAFGPNPATVQFDHLATDIQPESQTNA